MEDVSGPMSFLGVGYLWSHVLSGAGGKVSGRGVATKSGGMYTSYILLECFLVLKYKHNN